VRELKNVIERAVVLCRSQEIDQEDLLLTTLSTAGDTGEARLQEKFLPASLSDLESRHILATLHHTRWNKSRAAGLLGIERSTLDRKIRRYGLNDERPGSR
jgi:DNA-binding NtrC family response regulator